MTNEISGPLAITVLPDEAYRAPSMGPARLSHFHDVDNGGHFAAWEQPELFAAEVRAAFRSLRELVFGRRALTGSPPSHGPYGNIIWNQAGE